MRIQKESIFIIPNRYCLIRMVNKVLNNPVPLNTILFYACWLNLNILFIYPKRFHA